MKELIASGLSAMIVVLAIICTGLSVIWFWYIGDTDVDYEKLTGIMLCIIAFWTTLVSTIFIVRCLIQWSESSE